MSDVLSAGWCVRPLSARSFARERRPNRQLRAPCSWAQIGAHLQKLTDTTCISERHIMTQTMALLVLLLVPFYSVGLVSYRRLGRLSHCFDTILEGWASVNDSWCHTCISERHIMTQTVARLHQRLAPSYSAGLVSYRRFGRPSRCFDTIW